MYRYAVFRRDKSYLFDIRADNEIEALRKARAIDMHSETVVLVVPGNDLGVYSV